MKRMRVIAGEFKGRKLQSLKGDNTRPTSDKIKGAIFSRIGPYFDGGQVLDLYSGSGNLAIESISRGSDKAYCFDNHYQAIQTIQKNIDLTKANNQFVLKKMDATQALKWLSQDKIQFDIVFLDPPYAKEHLIEQLTFIEQNNLLNLGAYVICEADKQVELPNQIGQLIEVKRQIYGITQIVMYSLVGGEPDEE